MTILRPYDEVRLDPQVTADARVIHPTLISGEGRESVSDVYDWQAVVDRYNQALAPGPDAVAFSCGGEDLPPVRRSAGPPVRSRSGDAAGHGAGERLMDVELAVAELTTNTVVHGGGRGTLAVWAEQGQLVCEVKRAGWPISRSLSNFIDALAVRNNQTGGAQVHFWGPRYSVKIPANSDTISTVPDYATYDFNRLDIC